MNKRELARRLSEQTNITHKKAVNILDCLETEIASTLKKGEPVKIQGLGTFATRQRKARQGTNPKNGKTMDITEAVIPLFRPSQSFKSMVSGVSTQGVNQ